MAWRPRDPEVVRLGQFFLVGTGAAGVQTALLWLFVDAAGAHYLLAAAVAIEITIVLQYVANNAWTFSHTRHTGRREYLHGLFRTNLVRGSAIPLQVAALFALVDVFNLLYLVANLGAIFFSGIYRYVLDSRWTWSNAATTS